MGATRGRPETPDRGLTGKGARGFPRQHERLAVRFPEGADQLPAAACPPGEDLAQERRRRVLFCGQPDKLVVVALGERFGTHGGYRPFPFAGAGAFPIPVLAPMVSTVAGCWRCGFTFRAAPWPRGVRGSTQQRGPGRNSPGPLWSMSVVCFTSFNYFTIWMLTVLAVPSSSTIWSWYVPCDHVDSLLPLAPVKAFLVERL